MLIKYNGNDEAVTIPEGVTEIGGYYHHDDNGDEWRGAFYYCYNITSITVPDSVVSIGKGAFEYCKNHYPRQCDGYW